MAKPVAAIFERMGMVVFEFRTPGGQFIATGSAETREECQIMMEECAETLRREYKYWNNENKRALKLSATTD